MQSLNRRKLLSEELVGEQESSSVEVTYADSLVMSRRYTGFHGSDQDVETGWQGDRVASPVILSSECSGSGLMRQLTKERVMKNLNVVLVLAMLVAPMVIAQDVTTIKVTVMETPERRSINPKMDKKIAKKDKKQLKARTDGAKDLRKVLAKRGWSVVEENEDVLVEVSYRGWGESEEVSAFTSYYNQYSNTVSYSNSGQRLRQMICAVYVDGEFQDLFSSDVSVGKMDAVMKGLGGRTSNGPMSWGGAANNWAERFEEWFATRPIADN